MWLLLSTIFIASIFGSLHCVGMCGPFALLASSPSTEGKTQTKAIVSTLAYSAGRLVTYGSVGVIFGILGMALNRGTSFAPWQQTATYVAGGLMIFVGVIAVVRQYGLTIPLPNFAGQLSHVLQKLFLPVTRQPPLRKAFFIGALTCLMPCGWLYTFAIVAAGTGHPLSGAAVMVAFWAGTVPVMVALVLGFDRVGERLKQRIPMTMAVLVIAVGVFTIAYRAPVAIGETNSVVTGNANLVDQVESVDHQTLPCCSGKPHFPPAPDHP